MKKTSLLYVLSLLILLFIISTLTNPVFAQNASEIVTRSDEKMRGQSSSFELVITTVRPGWSRSMELRGWSKGTDYALILITAPAREKGVAFLKRGREVWNWYPTLERIIKLPPSMMNQSWMGTDFTNDDLVKESSIVKDYIHKLSGDTIIQNRPCYKIQLQPKPDAPVVWGSVMLCIDKTDWMELHARFYDEDGTLTQTMNAYDIRMMDGRLIPTRFEMIPADKKGQRTEMQYRMIRFNTALSDEIFTTDYLKRIRL